MKSKRETCGLYDLLYKRIFNKHHKKNGPKWSGETTEQQIRRTWCILPIFFHCICYTLFRVPPERISVSFRDDHMDVSSVWVFLCVFRVATRSYHRACVAFFLHVCSNTGVWLFYKAQLVSLTSKQCLLFSIFSIFSFFSIFLKMLVYGMPKN